MAARTTRPATPPTPQIPSTLPALAAIPELEALRALAAGTGLPSRDEALRAQDAVQAARAAHQAGQYTYDDLRTIAVIALTLGGRRAAHVLRRKAPAITANAISALLR